MTDVTKEPATREELIELRSETLWQAHAVRATGRPRSETWADVEEYEKEKLRFMARATLEAEEAAGLAVVPVEETVAMLDAAIAAEGPGGDGDAWRAKLAASPYAKKEGA